MERDRPAGPDAETVTGARGVQADAAAPAAISRVDAVLHLQRTAGNRAATIAVQRNGHRPPGSPHGAVAHRGQGHEWDLANNAFIDLARRAILQSYRRWLPAQVPNILVDPGRAQFHLMSPADFLAHIRPTAERDRIDPGTVQGDEEHGEVFVRANPGSHNYFVTLVHETLHAVSQPHASIPVPMLEGITQRLAHDAARAVGIETTYAAGNYAVETQAVAAMMAAAGPDAVMQAYFHGADVLPAAVQRAVGSEHGWAAAVALCARGDAGMTILRNLFDGRVRIEVGADGAFTYPDADSDPD